MDLVDDVYLWIDRILYAGAVALYLWAFIDCIFRKARAFPAVNKLTKVAWLAILVAAGALGYFFGYDPAGNLIGSVAVVAALVYLCDVRPAVREISGGKN